MSAFPSIFAILSVGFLLIESDERPGVQINMMAKQLKVATLNLGLGLKNKKDLVKELLMSNEIDILAMQEIELESNFDCNLLSIPGFTLVTENTRNKKRVGIYIKK